MPRPDLLALSPDDLAALANRGLVKRAQKELESGELTAEWEEKEDGSVSAKWSDGVTSTLPGGKTVKEGVCTCGAFELCRHLLRTVLAWQRRAVESAPEEAALPAAPWDPGRISDAMLEGQTTKAIRDRADALWSQGVLAELLRSAKPSARFYCPGHTVRFAVPDDLRYAQCSCSEPAPCVHAVLAVRAFRRLDPEADFGIVSEGPLDAAAPSDVLDAAEECVRELVNDGFASLGAPWRDRLRRVAAECAAAALMWPAQILEELADDFDRYAARDAAFTPGHSADRVGELLLRLDAIRAGCAPVPQAFIRGLRMDRDSDLGSARFIGLGASAAESRRSSAVTVFLQDADSGHALTLVREFTEDPESAAPRKPFHQLARATAVKDASLGLLAAGQLVTQGGRRTASGRLVIGRARAAVNPQSYAWEQLKAPVLVEDFAELSGRLRLLPPASFRPRREAADFHVCPVGAVEHAAFDPMSNAVVAVLRDRSGGCATLFHPWLERSEPGCRALLSSLTSGAKALFVAGHVRASGSGLVIRPVAVVFAGDGGSRRAVMPWIEPPSAAPVGRGPGASPARRQSGARYSAAAELASELLLNGARRLQSRQWPGWAQGEAETEECGCHRMAALLRQVRDPAAGAPAAFALMKLLALAKDAGA